MQLDNNIVIIKVLYGLGNRLRALASAYSIAEKTKKKLYVIWEKDFHCDCEFNDLFENSLCINNTIKEDIDMNNCDVYNYINDKNKYIDTSSDKIIYIESNGILNHESSFLHFYSFLHNLKPVKNIRDIIESYNVSNCIGMHIRMDGGENYQTNQAENGNNWKDDEKELMYKYRHMSHIDNFINQINEEICNDPNTIFFIATDLKSNYDKLINIYGEDKIKYIKREQYDRSIEQLYYAVADILVLAKCRKFYGSFWSSFTEIVTYFQEEDIKKNNILSNEFKKNKQQKISTIHVSKNRESNLINSINSYIHNDIVDDIVIVDFNSDINLRDFLIKNIDVKYFHKINIIEVINETNYIASYANNIGFYFCKNEIILKLDADNIIINSELFFDNYFKYDMCKHFIHYDWKNAKTENETHLNGIFITTKEQLKNNGYHNNNILFYGWEDCDIKNRHSNDKTIISFESKYFYHQEQDDSCRVTNQGSISNINFFGFNLKNATSVFFLIFYNKFLIELDTSITRETQVLNTFSVIENQYKYCKIKLNFDNIKIYNTNFNYLSESETSICNTEVFEKMCKETNNTFWIDTIHSKLYNIFVTKYKITDIKQKIRLFYILFFHKKNQIKNVNNNLVITLYNEKSIDRCLELLFCLKTNIENEHISKIHILYENPDENSFIFDIIQNMCNENLYNFNEKIIIQKITKTLTYNDIFSYCNENIEGNTILADSYIIYDETLENIQFLQEDDFISLTQYQKYDNKFKLAHLEYLHNKINIFSQDSWIFISPLKHNLECNMEMGKMFSDSFINYKLLLTNYKCFNLYESIKSFHIQNDISESKNFENNKESIDKQWQYVYELNNKITTSFLYGIRKNTICDFKNKENYNNFISWDLFLHSKKEDVFNNNKSL